ncbi:transcription-repair coupling factor [Nonlabens ulvanivorans]|nr:transcription-repair coupling factor [Nonlabens ulvanivorans]
MRGRVGRSNKKAFCYFITPPYDMMTDDARKRIQAVETFSELGSGFNIAMKDLEIRGAGDILGGEQSGFMNEIGFDTYQKILNEAIEELKENEFKDLYDEEKVEKIHVSDVTIDTEFELLFPDDYINSITERLALYSKLNELNNEAELEVFKKELEDRFGELPDQADDLLTSIKLKWIAARMGLEKVIMKQDKLIGYFIADQQSNFYQTETFSIILQAVQQQPRVLRMKEKQTRGGLRLLLTVDKVKTVDRAYEILNTILPVVEKV